MTATTTVTATEQHSPEVDLLEIVRESEERNPLDFSHIADPMAEAFAEIEPVDPMGLTVALGDQFYWKEGNRTNTPERLSARQLGEILSELAQTTDTTDVTDTKDKRENVLRFGAKCLLVLFGLAYDPTGNTEEPMTSYARALTAYSREAMGEIARKKSEGVEFVADKRLSGKRELFFKGEDVALVLAEIEDVFSSRQKSEEGGPDSNEFLREEAPSIVEPEQITEHELAVFRRFAEQSLPHINPNEIDANLPSVRRIQENGKTVASLIDTTGYNDDIKKIYAEAIENRKERVIDLMLDVEVRRATEFKAHLGLRKISAGIKPLVARGQGSNDRLLRAYFCRIGKDSNGLPLFALLGLSRTKEREAKLLTVLEGNEVRASDL